MALLSLKPKQDQPSADTKVPKDLEERIERGRKNQLEPRAPMVDEAWEFVRGNHYAFVNDKGKLQVLSSGYLGVTGADKAAWQSRQRRNFIFDVALRETSAAASRVPGYQVVPTSRDPAREGAARMAEKVALYGYHKWHLRDATVAAVMHAVVGGEAFAWPYFDTTVGPFIDDGQGNRVGQGEVCVRIYGSNQVYWEPGVRFENSPWHVVEQARPIYELEAMEGFLGGSLSADASTRALSSRKTKKDKLALEVHYLERPSAKKPQGSWVTMSNGKRILADRPYPAEGPDPVLRKLSYAKDADSDRDLALIPQLLDAQRTANDSDNKTIEIKNLFLFPRVAARPGVFKKQPWSTQPGSVYETADPDSIKILDQFNFPRELFEIKDRAVSDLNRIAAYADPSPQNQSGKSVQAQLDFYASRRGDFFANLAEWASQVMHDCLREVQGGYTEPRLLQIKGDFGWEPIEDFEGKMLMDETDVRVFPDSIEPQDRQAQEQKLMNYANLAWISPQQAMTAIETGTSAGILKGLAFDEARAGRIIQRFKQGPEAVFSMPSLPTGRLTPAVDPTTGQPTPGGGQPEFSPGFMPRYSDNLPVFRSLFEDWMKTEEFEQLDWVTPDGLTAQMVAANIYAGIIQLQGEKEAEQAAAQAAQAEQLGMGNAAAPQTKPKPSLPSLADQSGNGSTSGQ